MTQDEIRALVHQIAASMPPLGDEQRDRLTELLRPTVTAPSGHPVRPDGRLVHQDREAGALRAAA